MVLTSSVVKQKAKELGIDDIGIAGIDIFKNAPPMMNPLNYFPNAKSVICIAMRIPRGTYRGIEEGTHWHNYAYYSYSGLNLLYIPRLKYELACFIEDFGWEAVPHYAGVPERNPVIAPIEEGRIPHDVVMNIRLIGVGCGCGEMGHSKVFLNPKFGPRVRMGMILTDAELEPDPIMEPGTICNKCGRCSRDCPGNAIPGIKEKDRMITVKIGDKDISWSDVHMGRCTFTHMGLNNTVSPFLRKDLPNFEYDVENSDVTEEEAFKLVYGITYAEWTRTVFNPEGPVLRNNNYTIRNTGLFAICGARGCIRACMDNLERTGRIENRFKNQYYKKKPWKFSNKRTEKVGGLNPWREKWLDENYPELRKGEPEAPKSKW